MSELDIVGVEDEGEEPVLFDPEEPWISLREALETDDAARLVAIFEELTLSDGLRALLQLDVEERGTILSALPPALAAELVTEAPNEQAVELVEISRRQTPPRSSKRWIWTSRRTSSANSTRRMPTRSSPRWSLRTLPRFFGSSSMRTTPPAA